MSEEKSDTEVLSLLELSEGTKRGPWGTEGKTASGKVDLPYRGGSQLPDGRRSLRQGKDLYHVQGGIFSLRQGKNSESPRSRAPSTKRSPHALEKEKEEKETEHFTWRGLVEKKP